MSQRAPGQDSASAEPACYNCGAKGHITVACPEPTRAVPAGLEAFRQRQAAGQNASSNSTASHSKHSNGMVVTRYPPPPSAGPQITHYPPPPPPQSVPPPPPPSFPAHPVPAHPVPAQYSPPPVPWNHGPPGYGPPYPSLSSPPGYPPYGAPGPPPMTPPVTSPYPQPYPQPSYFPPQPHGPPSGPPAYPPVHNGPLHHPLPAPPPYATPVPYPPPPTYSYSPPPAISPPFPRSRGPPPAHGRKHDRHNRGRNNGPQGRGHRHQSPQRASSSQRERQPSSTAESATSTPGSGHHERSRSRNADPPVAREEEDEFEWELTTVFNEHKTAPADPVGKPLPSVWNDDPTIPPAFNAKVVVSEFFKDDNVDEFCKSIRDDAHWTAAKLDPSFKFRKGMVLRDFPNDSHRYPTYQRPSPVGDASQISAHDSPERDWAGSPTDPWSPRANRARLASSHATHKRVEAGGRASQTTSPPHPLDPSATTRRLGKRLHDDVSVPHPRDDKRPRHSGARSVSEQDPRRLPGIAGLPSKPPPPHLPRRPDAPGLPPDSSHPASTPGKRRPFSDSRRPSSRSPSSERRQRANNSQTRRAASRDRPATASSNSSRSSSPLDDLEYEMLGMSRPAEEEVPKKKAAPTTQSTKPRRAKVADAFSRRW
ncbi:uncharacterized protein E0L32_000552 [Thyridium curvatum]|uniref:CCHC-type domain-containing protein n=1 Tax=Thyridium curvatum TaxID=1093900 RepID=A0A507BBE1_9PEZI|nr:uncharacterized protein E0L32_000552 [Thyridium curvatum]TPX14158.1 hypothetical protein E0L32_000552 [Thyridium curvatum]